MGSTVFGEEWYKMYMSFRKNPKLFLDQNKFTKDTFCVDLLKDLYSDTVPIKCKFFLLLALEQHASFLIYDENALEQIIEPLRNLYTLIEDHEDKKLLRSQILITLTSLLLSWNDANENICAILVDLRLLFLRIILSTRFDDSIQSTACQCLLEIEQIFPCISKDDLNGILAACKRDEQKPVQNYAVLISTILKYKSELPNIRFSSEPMDRALNKIIGSPITRKNSTNDLQVHSIVSFLLDLVPSMSPASVYIMFQNLIQVIMNTPEMLPAVFKPFLPRMIMSFDLLYFHTAFELLIAFGSELYSTQDEKLLLHQLFMSIKQPLFNVSQCLLYMDWLKTCAVKKDIFSISVSNNDSDLKVLIPGPFDGPMTQAKKLCLLALCFQSRQNTAACCKFLMKCLGGLRNQALVTKGITVPVAFFQSLYTLFALYDNIPMHSDVQRLVLDVATSAPHLFTFVLDFLRSVKVECKKSDFSDNILSVLVDYVLNLPMKQFAANIKNFLPVLERAAVEIPYTCKPQMVVRQLKKVLLDAETFNVETWVIAHGMMSVCRAFLKFHDVEVLYHDLGELLHLLIKNVKDVDCRDRAKQYYSALTALPQARVKEIFKNESERSCSSSLATLVTGSERSFHSRSITELSKPIFHLIRKNVKFQNSSDVLEVSEVPKTGLKDSYEEFINSESFRLQVKIPFLLKHVEGIDTNYSVVYCVIIDVETKPACYDVTNVEIPVLKVPSSEDDKESPEVEVTFWPKISHPLELHFKVQFTCGDGSVCTFPLPPVKVEFDDLFSSLPITFSESKWKQQLFDELWGDIKENRGCLTMHRLKLSDLKSLIQTHWDPFVIVKETDTSFAIGILLPLSSHLLMRVKLEDENVFMTILVEDHRILPFISSYLQVIENEMTKGIQ